MLLCLPGFEFMNNKDFTLLETLTTVVVVGVLAAITAPSFIKMQERAEFNDAVDKIRSSMQITQREAIKRSKRCTLSIPEGSNPALTSTCLLLDSKPLKNISIDNLAVTGTLALNYSYRGNVQNNQVIIVSRIDGTDSKCIATSLIGSIRVGTWDGTDCLAEQ